MKDRLVELLQEASTEAGKHFRETTKKVLAEKGRFNSATDIDRKNIYEVEADYLLENGVIVPPYKVGTRIYAVVSRTSDNKNFYIVEDEITHYRIVDGLTIMCLKEHLGLPDFKWDKVFSTREEAEAKLKEGGQE